MSKPKSKPIKSNDVYKTCPKCGTAYPTYKDKEYFGCPHCGAYR